jgi:hypothetical protein
MAANDLAFEAARELSGGVWTDLRRRLNDLFKPYGNRFPQIAALVRIDEAPDFDSVVSAMATKLVLKASTDQREQAAVVAEARKILGRLPDDSLDEESREALRQGDKAIITLLTAGTSFVGLGVAVEVGGFGAYIAAAKAAALVPLIGAKGLVSTLFVLSHPLIIVPLIGGFSWAAERHLRKTIGRRLAASLAPVLALRGAASPESGLKTALDAFRACGPAATNMADAGAYASIANSVRSRLGADLPPSPKPPPGRLSKLPGGRRRNDLMVALFPGSNAGAGSEALALAGLSLGEVLYAAASIRPEVVAALDFSRTADLSDIFRFGTTAAEILERPGANIALDGYTAEQVVLARLHAQGHQVELPPTPSNPGWDICVDGVNFQVKCGLSADLIDKHFEKYPDIPVIANLDAAVGRPEWAEKVYFVDGYDHESVQRLVSDSIEAGASLGDVNLPLWAIAVSVGSSIHDWWRGQVELAELPWEVAVNASVKGGLVAVGGLAGNALGLLLLGPAGAVVFGTAGGAAALIGAAPAREWLEALMMPQWHADLERAAVRLLNEEEVALTRKIAILEGKIAALRTDAGEEIAWLKSRLIDDRVFLYERLGELDLLSAAAGQSLHKARSAVMLLRRAGIHKETVKPSLKNLLEVLARRGKVFSGMGKRMIDRLPGLQTPSGKAV